MDFTKLNETEHADKGATLKKVIGPDGVTVLPGVTVTMLGAKSTKGRMAVSLYRKDKSIKQLMDESLDELKAQKLVKLIALTQSWTGFEWDGKPLDCTKVNIKDLYEKDGFEWLTDQLEIFSENSANFFDLANEV